MIRNNDYPIIRPSDAVAWSECIRRVWLDNKGELDHEQTEDAFGQLVKDRGLKHEQQVLKLLHEEYDVQVSSHVIFNSNIGLISSSLFINERHNTLQHPHHH